MADGIGPSPEAMEEGHQRKYLIGKQPYYALKIYDSTDPVSGVPEPGIRLSHATSCPQIPIFFFPRKVRG